MKIAYCIIDNTHTYSSDWIKSLMKNQADYTVTNIISKGYQVYASTSEDRVLRQVSNLDYNYAVVFSTGTEFINGDNFFDAVKNVVSENIFITGHILDRGDAYYELHHQCYVINLEIYKKLGYPKIGQQQLGNIHTQIEPIRSSDNFHDNYTPTWVSHGSNQKKYNHKLHGWNILSYALSKQLSIGVFSEDVRQHKKHFYPENPIEFYKHISWAYQRQAYCEYEFVHTESTDTNLPALPGIRQVFVPASGLGWEHVSTDIEKVVVYDYNQKALDYWQQRVPTGKNINYKFVKLDLLHNDIDIESLLDTNVSDTFINLSNIFAYEGTAFFANLEYRKYRQKLLVDKIKVLIPTAVIYTSVDADTGITHELPWHTYDHQP